MQFIDEAKIFIESGAGGNGYVSFLREANMPKGGPNGGDGAKGGDVIIKGVGNLNTLIDFRYKQHFKAERGGNGKGKNMHGAQGKDLIITVPFGTQVLDENSQELICDISEQNSEYKILTGGKGGAGNYRYRSSTNQRPLKFGSGEDGQKLWIWLKLKLISDVGIIGLPNAGKSTLISTLSRAKPKIADYPFTTLIPNLGVVYVDHQEFVIADIPGLINGAHLGVGLGHKFLKHIERCRLLLHLIDINSEDLIEQYNIIRNELKMYNTSLATKTEIIALSKIDTLEQEMIKEKQRMLQQYTNNKVYLISAVTQQNCNELVRELLNKIADQDNNY